MQMREFEFDFFKNQILYRSKLFKIVVPLYLLNNPLLFFKTASNILLRFSICILINSAALNNCYSILYNFHIPQS